MPKVYFNDYDKAIDRFRRWFYNEKNSRNITQNDLVRPLGVTQTSVSEKLSLTAKSMTNISLRDAIIILHKMDATDEEILKLMKI